MEHWRLIARKRGTPSANDYLTPFPRRGFRVHVASRVPASVRPPHPPQATGGLHTQPDVVRGWVLDGRDGGHGRRARARAWAGLPCNALGIHRRAQMVQAHLKPSGFPDPLHAHWRVLGGGTEGVRVSSGSDLPVRVRSGGAFSIHRRGKRIGLFEVRSTQASSLTAVLMSPTQLLSCKPITRTKT